MGAFIAKIGFSQDPCGGESVSIPCIIMTPPWLRQPSPIEQTGTSAGLSHVPLRTLTIAREGAFFVP